MNNSPFTQKPPTSVLQVQFIAAAIAATPLVYFFVCLYLHLDVLEEPGGFVGISGMASSALFCAGMLIACLSGIGAWWARDRIPARTGILLQDKMTATVVAMALAEIGAAFGFVLFVLTGNLVMAALLMAISLVSAITIFPTRRWLDKS